jgi:hypothetical protein
MCNRLYEWSHPFYVSGVTVSPWLAKRRVEIQDEASKLPPLFYGSRDKPICACRPQQEPLVKGPEATHIDVDLRLWRCPVCFKEYAFAHPFLRGEIFQWMDFFLTAHALAAMLGWIPALIAGWCIRLYPVVCSLVIAVYLVVFFSFGRLSLLNKALQRYIAKRWFPPLPVGCGVPVYSASASEHPHAIV